MNGSLGCGNREIAAAFGRVPLFARLGAAERHLLRHARVVVYPKGAVLFRQGGRPPHVFVLLAGQVKVVRKTCAGREVILDLGAGPGLCGEFAAYTGRPHLTTAIAVLPSSVGLLSSVAFRALIDGSPVLARRFLEMSQRRYEQPSGVIEDLAGRPVEQRLASVLTGWPGTERHVLGGERVIPLPMRRKELAALAATTTETVVRVLTRWRSLGAVVRARHDLLAPVHVPEAVGVLRPAEVAKVNVPGHAPPGGVPNATDTSVETKTVVPTEA
jgi:CRP/FNR family transcriptional regulator